MNKFMKKEHLSRHTDIGLYIKWGCRKPTKHLFILGYEFIGYHYNNWNFAWYYRESPTKVWFFDGYWFSDENGMSKSFKYDLKEFFLAECEENYTLMKKILEMGLDRY